jgi:RNA polymerase sigma-32 factor
MIESKSFTNRRAALRESLSVLDGQERRIFEARRLADEPSSLDELAHEFGVSCERARQIEVRAFEKVQNAVRHRAQPPSGRNPIMPLPNGKARH